MDADKNLIVSEQDANIVTRWCPAELAQSFAVETTLPVLTPQDRIAVLRIVDCEHAPAADMIGRIIEVGHYVIHPVDQTDEATGETYQAARTLLPQSNGATIGFVSKSILTSIGRLAWSQNRLPPFVPPVLARLVKRGRVYRLIPADEQK